MILFYISYISLNLLILSASIYFITIIILSGFMKRAPMIPSSGKSYKTIILKISERIINCEKDDYPTPFKTVDAGCGIGTLLIPLAKIFPKHQFVGIEYSYSIYLIAKFRSRNIKNLTIIHKNIFNYSFDDANFIICFLMSSIMESFTKKCTTELKKESYIFSNRFKLIGLEPFETIDLGDKFSYIHLYKFTPKLDNKVQ